MQFELVKMKENKNAKVAFVGLYNHGIAYLYLHETTSKKCKRKKYRFFFILFFLLQTTQCFLLFFGVPSASTRKLYEKKLQKLLDQPPPEAEAPAEVTILPKADSNQNGNTNSDQYSDKEDGERPLKRGSVSSGLLVSLW